MLLVRRNLLVLALVLFSPILFANEVTAVWTRLYGTAATTEQKLAIMTNIVEQHSREMIPVLQDALEQEVNNLENISGSTQRDRVYSLMRMIVDELGDLKATASADVLSAVSEEVSDPFLQAAAIRALGKIGAAGNAQEIAFRLRNINLRNNGIHRQGRGGNHRFCLRGNPGASAPPRRLQSRLFHRHRQV